MEKETKLHKRNIFNEIKNDDYNQRQLLEKIAKDKINPVTGEAHYYRIKLDKLRNYYRIYIPRDDNFKPLLEDTEDIKIYFPRDKDPYIVIERYNASE